MAGSIPVSSSVEPALVQPSTAVAKAVAAIAVLTPEAKTAPVEPVRPPASPARESWRRFRRHRLAVVSLAVLALLISGVLAGPWLWLRLRRATPGDGQYGVRLAGAALAASAAWALWMGLVHDQAPWCLTPT